MCHFLVLIVIKLKVVSLISNTGSGIFPFYRFGVSIIYFLGLSLVRCTNEIFNFNDGPTPYLQSYPVLLRYSSLE
uniref:Uncharacterized protein n=1 Tax=Kalanchoe fedtschenkoi TaxID=63787 RepID=A0A7N0UC28_KALFE